MNSIEQLEQKHLRIFELIDKFYDNPANFKDIYPLDLIKEIAKEFYISEEAALKRIKEYYKSRPSLKVFAVYYKDFMAYSKTYEKKLGDSPSLKILNAILNEVIKIEADIQGNEYTEDSKKKQMGMKADKLRFLFDYLSFKYFNYGDSSLPDQELTEEERVALGIELTLEEIREKRKEISKQIRRGE